MESLILNNIRELNLVEQKMPIARKGEVIIRTSYCGICGSDKHAYEGKHPRTKYPLILGHEFSGIIDKLGKDVKDFLVGEKVVIDPNIVCNKCYYCRCGKRHFCENLKSIGINMNGAYSQYVAVPASNLYRVPDSVTMKEAALTEPIACVLHAIDELILSPGSSALVLGAGPIGLLFSQILHNCGYYPVVVSEINRNRQKVAGEISECITINPLIEDINKKTREITDRRGFDIVIDTTGNIDALEESVNLLSKTGKLMIFSLYSPSESLALSLSHIYKNEISIYSDFTNPYTMQRALNLISSKTLKLNEMINVISLNSAIDYFNKEDKKKIETLIDPWL